MACILTFVEQRDGAIRKASLEALCEAKRQADAAGWGTCAALIGHGIADRASALGAQGVATVYVVDDARLTRYAPEGYAAALQAVVERCAPQALFMAGTIVSRDLAGRVEAPLIARATARTKGNQLKAAEILGMNRNTLRERMRAGGLPQIPASAQKVYVRSCTSSLTGCGSVVEASSARSSSR